MLIDKSSILGLNSRQKEVLNSRKDAQRARCENSIDSYTHNSIKFSCVWRLESAQSLQSRPLWTVQLGVYTNTFSSTVPRLPDKTRKISRTVAVL